MVGGSRDDELLVGIEEHDVGVAGLSVMTPKGHAKAPLEFQGQAPFLVHSDWFTGAIQDGGPRALDESDYSISYTEFHKWLICI